MHLCELDFEASAVLLPPGCYLNHSCDPNAMRSGVKVFAWKDIRECDEITIDYRLNAFGDESSTRMCRSVNCLGEVVWSFFALDEDVQRQYLPYAPSFIKSPVPASSDDAEELRTLTTPPSLHARSWNFAAGASTCDGEEGPGVITEVGRERRVRRSSCRDMVNRIRPDTLSGDARFSVWLRRPQPVSTDRLAAASRVQV
jgi:hypothetical protein